MKRTLYNLIAILVTVSVFFAACTKEDPDVKLDPKLSTTQMSNITSDGATLEGFVVASGSGFTERGICYNTATAPTVANKKAIYTGESKKATFTVSLTELTYATKYFARAYATNAEGVTIYGEEFNFTTKPVVPELSTAAITEITGNTATGGGMVLVTGGSAVTKQGICWSTNRNPTIADNKTENGNASGLYISALTNLKGLSYYYVRAYATNSAGTGYGPEVFFETKFDKPTVTTTEITGITATTAKSGGNVTYDGGAAVTSRGVCWSTNADPTIADNKTSNGTGSGAFTSALTGLNVATLYHVRAYAVNSVGVSYGPETIFVTFPPAIYALGDGTEAGWDNSKAVKIEQSGSAGIYVGTLTLSAAKFMKFILTLGQWAPMYGTDASATTTSGKLVFRPTESFPDPASIPTPAAAGNYKVTVDLGKMTYKVETAFPAALYMIGAGVGDKDWKWELTDLPMVPVNSHPNLFWKIVFMNATGEFKMAPEKAWGNDFGKAGSATGGIYNKGGENIPVPGIAGYYMVVVDLTTNKISIADPKVYLIGNTIGSWDTGNAAGLFTVDNANSLVTITKTLAADNLRMYAWHPWFDQWWQSEFNIFSGKIVFRGTGNDQAAVPVTAGSHKIDLNFKTGDGAVN